jgi:hypothetical protein
MSRSRLVQARSPDHVPSQRLRAVCDGYRVATDILLAIMDRGCDGDTYDLIQSFVDRERVAYETRAGARA